MLETIAITAAIGSAVVAGMLYAFSAFVMRALRSVADPHGAAVMQAINVEAVRAGLMVPFFGTLLLSLAVGWIAISEWREPASPWLLAGAALYVIGVFVVTAVFHVPRNNALAEVDPASPAGQAAWASYAVSWTRGNHVRSVLGMLAAMALTVGVLLV